MTITGTFQVSTNDGHGRHQSVLTASELPQGVAAAFENDYLTAANFTYSDGSTWEVARYGNSNNEFDLTGGDAVG